MKIIAAEPHTGQPGHFKWFTTRSCEALVRAGNDVVLVAHGGFSHAASGNDFLYRMIDAAPQEDAYATRVDGISIGHTRGFRGFLSRQVRELRVYSMVAQLLQRQEVDVLHLFDVDPITLLYAIHTRFRKRLRAGRPVTVMTLHEVGRMDPSRGIGKRLYHAVYRLCLKRLMEGSLDGVVVLDEWIKHALVSRLRLNDRAARRVRVFPIGVDEPGSAPGRAEARAKLGLDPAEVVFLLPGILRRDKRVDLAVQAIGGLPGSRLLVVGRTLDVDWREIEDLIHSSGCGEAVTAHLGYVNEESLQDYFSASDAVLLPYSKSFTGSSGVLTRACTHERCVIASNIGQLGEFVRREKIGFVVEPDNPSDLRAAMLKFLATPPDERAAMERHAHLAARKYSWDSVSSEWVVFYNELLSDRPPKCAA